jgi:16S rRNA (cytosine1402-N4)-methyltransferase
MDPTRGQPVSVWLMQTSIDELKKVIADYGEERFAFQIADAIATRCEEARRGDAAPLESTKALADLVAATLRRCRARPEPGQHPATRTFQALRIHINGELDELVVVLKAALELLRESGRLAVISFHSIEDRIVKQFIRDWSGKAPRSSADRTLTRAQEALLETIAQQQSGTERSTKLSACLKPIARIRPSAAEVARNPRARSATLRIAERLPHLHRGRL